VSEQSGRQKSKIQKPGTNERICCSRCSHQCDRMQQQQHHSRRKKKRVNYGTRTVELNRGGKGFGFTISGQQPCILSCIVPGSPAELAGLRSGDYLVSVNGHRVGKAPHDDVVRLIGRSNGLLRLRIAENYYSDSSDEEETEAKIRSRPRYRSVLSVSEQHASINVNGVKYYSFTWPFTLYTSPYLYVIHLILSQCPSLISHDHS
jgi:hypothetical protein